MKIPTIFIGEQIPTKEQYKAIVKFKENNPSAIMTGEKGFYSNGVCKFYFFWKFDPEDVVSIGFNPDGTLYV